MKEQFNEVMDVLVDLMGREDLPKALAKFYSRTYDALITEGFTEGAAMDLLKTMSIPNTKS